MGADGQYSTLPAAQQTSQKSRRTSTATTLLRPLLGESYSLGRDIKSRFVPLDAVGSGETLFRRATEAGAADPDEWIVAIHALFGESIRASGETDEFDVELRTATGSIATGKMGWAVVNRDFGGDFGITVAAYGFDRHHQAYAMLNNGCDGMVIMSGSTLVDGVPTAGVSVDAYQVSLPSLPFLMDGRCSCLPCSTTLLSTEGWMGGQRQSTGPTAVPFICIKLVDPFSFTQRFGVATMTMVRGEVPWSSTPLTSVARPRRSCLRRICPTTLVRHERR